MLSQTWNDSALDSPKDEDSRFCLLALRLYFHR